MAIGSDADDRRREVLDRLITPDGKPREGLQDAPTLNSADVGALFQMTERSIRMLATKGELPHRRTLGGGRLLYPADEIAALYAQYCSNRGSQGSPGWAEEVRNGDP